MPEAGHEVERRDPGASDPLAPASRGAIYLRVFGQQNNVMDVTRIDGMQCANMPSLL